MDVAVVGAGSWGTALALVLARNGHDIGLYGRESETLTALKSARENLRYLPGFVLPDNCEISELTDDPVPAPIAVLAVPTTAVEQVLPAVKNSEIVCIASKGLVQSASNLLSQLVGSVLPDARLVALSGPNLARELAQGIPTAAVAASNDAEAAETVRNRFMSRNYRVYLSDDITGVELAGAMKNVMAIAAGMSDGLGFGNNTKGALLARGLNEMARLGEAIGARRETFMGLAGVGDLFATAASDLSRNNRVGYGLGKGRALSDVLDEIGQVAEGVQTSQIAVGMARLLQVDAPITQVVDAVVRGQMAARDAVVALMERAPAKETLV